MTRNDAATLDVRASRTQPGKYVICFTDTQVAVEHPSVRVAGKGYTRSHALNESYFDTFEEALAAIPEWRKMAEEMPRARVPLKGLTVARVVTLAEEMSAARIWQAKREKDPWHECHPCSGMHCQCLNNGVAPSREMLAMQAGKAAYGKPAKSR